MREQSNQFHFRMARAVAESSAASLRRLALVVSLTDNPAIGIGEDGTKRHVAAGDGEFGLLEC